ncbi:hypothetical protein F4774DRAFT_195518 [Daldinia eschscholtzii]|nr:hypothetical protein F4774DRAFT_195518 [Daldinia eschscholtzii]
MAQVYRERDVRYTREDSPSSDDERYKSTTVRRYKVGGGGRVVERDRIDRYEEDDDRRSRHSHSHSHSHSHAGRSTGELVEVDRHYERTYPERPRSAFDSHDHYTTVEYERERDVDRDHYPERHSRTKVVEEIKTSSPPPRDNYWDRRQAYPWDDVREDVRVEKRIVREEAGGELQVKEKTEEFREEPRDYKERDLMIERRVDIERDSHDVDVERYRKEVEYYAPPPAPSAPVVIRQKFPEQKVVIHEAPAPAPVVLPRQEPTYIVLRDERRQVAPRPEPREEEDYHYRREDRRRRDERQYESDGYDEDYYIKRTIITRERSSSSDHHKKRHLAEGALAGAGLTALLARGGKNGEYHEHRGRKVLAGAALGALGTEAVRRAKSAYEDRHEDRYEDHEYYDDDHRHRHRSKSRSRLTTGLAIGAAALAVAGGLKYMQNNKAEKEEANRGRARRRYSDDEYSTSRSRSSRGRSRSKSKSKAAKAALATGALAGIVEHYRSKSRGKSRSKSRLRTGAEIAAAGLTGAAAEKLWEHHKDKKESKERERHRDSDDEYYDRDRGYSRSRSRSRSLSRRSHSRDSTADRELGLVPVVPGVEYGSEPIEGYESATEEPRRRRRKHDHRSPSTSDREARKKRSRSRLRDVAAAGIGTAAAAMGIKKLHDRQKSKEREGKSRDSSRDRSLDREDRDREKRKARRSRDRERRRYEEEAPDDPYYDYHAGAPPSPPHASGGAYYPPPPAAPEPAGPPPAGFTQHPNQSTPNVNAYSPYPPYNPQDYAGVSPMNLPPPPPGPPPSGPPHGSGNRTGPENVSHPRSGDIKSHHDASRSTATEQDGVKDNQRSLSPRSRSADAEPSATKVKFVPLSPKSSRTLRRHRRRMGERSEEDIDEELAQFQRPPNFRRRSGSDVSSNRPRVQRRRVRGDESPVSDDSEIEYLPDRFDSSGQPLETNNTALNGIPRQGSFEYLPRNENDWHVRGAWKALGDPDPVLVNDIAQTIGGFLRPGGTLLNIFEHALRDI